jgi:hypothetical protein
MTKMHASIWLAGCLLSAGARAQPTVLVAEFRSLDKTAVVVVSDDVRAGVVATVAARGGTVVTKALEQSVVRASLPACSGTPSTACDLAIGRQLSADLIVTGEQQRVDGQLSLSIEVIGTTSGKLLAGKRVVATTVNALGAAARGDVNAALDEIFDRLGPPRVGPNPVAAQPVAVRADDTVLLQQPANMFRGIESVGGTVSISSRGVQFQPHAVNVQGGGELILFADVVDIQPVNTMGVVPNGAVLLLRGGGERRFVLNDRDAFIGVARQYIPK